MTVCVYKRGSVFKMHCFKIKSLVILIALTVSTGKNDKFEYECDVLRRMDDLENQLEVAMKKIITLEAKMKEAKPVSETCAFPWVVFNESCLLFGTELLTFLDAEAFCQSENAHLVHVHSAAKNEFLQKYAKANSADYWIGFTDLVNEGSWRWYGTDEPVTYTDWAFGQPDNGDAGEDCGQFYKRLNYHWNDVECYRAFKPICERKH